MELAEPEPAAELGPAGPPLEGLAVGLDGGRPVPLALEVEPLVHEGLGIVGSPRASAAETDGSGESPNREGWPRWPGWSSMPAWPGASKPWNAKPGDACSTILPLREGAPECSCLRSSRGAVSEQEGERLAGQFTFRRSSWKRKPS